MVGSDYRSELFYTTEKQRRVAEDTLADAGASGISPGKLVTKISQARSASPDATQMSPPARARTAGPMG